MQMASMVVGTAAGARRLDSIAREVLGLDLPKALQTSYWPARDLSDGQLVYAASDAYATYRAGRALYRRLGERERQAFWLANSAVPPIAKMQLRGLPFDRARHEQTIAIWQREYAEERERLRQQTGQEVPLRSPAIRAWLEQRLSPEAMEQWPRTEKSGVLKTGAEKIKRLAQDYPEVLPLLEVQKKERKAALDLRCDAVRLRCRGDRPPARRLLPADDYRPLELPRSESPKPPSRRPRRHPCG
jgi:hypothetical protein